MSIDRCFDVYFKDLKVIVKGKSQDQNILLGKAEMVADKEATNFELR